MKKLVCLCQLILQELLKKKGEYVVKRGLGGLFTWTIDNDHGLLYNAAREGLGCKIEKQNIDMSKFYFKGKTKTQDIYDVKNELK